MMKPHWTENKEQILEQLRAPARVLIALDFDGTLAPIVPRPEDAALPAETLLILRQLASSRGVFLAIVSGRSIRDVSSRVPVPGIVFSGNHGLETQGLGLDGQSPQAQQLRSKLNAISADLAAYFAGLEGIHIEDKQLSLSIHYRKVPDQWQASVISQIDTALQDFPEFRTQPGHKVMEIVPALPINKATAVQRLLSRLRLPQRACFFAGDDIADENVFRAFPNAVTVSVSQKITAARWIADSPADLAGLLAALKK